MGDDDEIVEPPHVRMRLARHHRRGISDASTIRRLVDEGMSVAEIVAASGLSDGRVRRVAKRHEIQLQRAGINRHVSTRMHRKIYAKLVEVAGNLGCDVSDVVADMNDMSLRGSAEEIVKRINNHRGWVERQKAEYRATRTTLATKMHKGAL